MKRHILIAIVAVIVVLAVCVVSFADEKPPVGESVAAFSSELLDGTAIDGSIFSAYTVSVVNLWATWCGPCLGELPYLQSCYAANGSNAGAVGIYGLLLEGESASDASAIFASGGYAYPCFTEDSVWTAITNLSPYVPQTFLIDSNGVVLEREVGSYSSADELQARIDYWLDKLGGAPSPTGELPVVTVRPSQGATLPTDLATVSPADPSELVIKPNDTEADDEGLRRSEVIFTVVCVAVAIGAATGIIVLCVSKKKK